MLNCPSLQSLDRKFSITQLGEITTLHEALHTWLNDLLNHRLFFFSSRRRHTRWPHDWSSDVCSSDLVGLWVWARLDRSMARAAMEAIGEDETAAASVGIHVTRFKLAITTLSAVLTAASGILYAQYITYVNPETLAGIGVSLRIVFAVVLGGMYSLLGPTVGTALTIALSEYLRVVFGLKFIGMAETIYGLLLVLFIIFLPSGIYGSLREALRRPRLPARATA